jgi:lysylphosphatidylglycerol synthetase-like protein (DUF2156 family)
MVARLTTEETRLRDLRKEVDVMEENLGFQQRENITVAVVDMDKADLVPNLIKSIKKLSDNWWC